MQKVSPLVHTPIFRSMVNKYTLPLDQDSQKKHSTGHEQIESSDDDGVIKFSMIGYELDARPLSPDGYELSAFGQHGGIRLVVSAVNVLWYRLVKLF